LDNDNDACNTLKMNRPSWVVREDDIHSFSGAGFSGVDLLAGGVPCPPFSIAGKQLGKDDERDLFPEALRLVKALKPSAVLLENVRGLATSRFHEYREAVLQNLRDLGYVPDWKLLNASDFGVPQLRPRFVLVALLSDFAQGFRWPSANGGPPTVGKTLKDLMAAREWPGAEAWAKKANGIAPTIVGGSKKHGGPDLGPTRARAAWRELAVDGLGLANTPPSPDFPLDSHPKLTTRMVARLQGFPDDWLFSGGKTTVHRQVGNAFPPPVARAVGIAVRRALSKDSANAAD
jgi:DNA (cytosine-5)-methyltransferase 1